MTGCCPSPSSFSLRREPREERGQGRGFKVRNLMIARLRARFRPQAGSAGAMSRTWLREAGTGVRGRFVT